METNACGTATCWAGQRRETVAGFDPKLLIESLYPFCWHGLTHDVFILGYLYVLIIFVFREKKQMLFVTLDLVTE